VNRADWDRLNCVVIPYNALITTFSRVFSHSSIKSALSLLS
jgi:hypothetical protein